MIKRMIRKQIKKHGVKNFILKGLDVIAKATPNNKDDEMVAKIKEVMANFD